MVIVDTSIIFKWFIEKETDFDAAFKLFENHVSKKEKIVVPSILLYEIANALVTKSQIAIKEVSVYLQRLEESEIEIVEFTFEQIKRTALFAKKYKVSVYDAAYAVLAKEKGCPLVTADTKFIKQVNLPFVKDLAAFLSK